MMPDNWHVVLVLISKTDLKNIAFPGELTLANPDQGLIGMLPVFKDEEAARKCFPNDEVLPIQMRPREVLNET